MLGSSKYISTLAFSMHSQFFVRLRPASTPLPSDPTGVEGPEERIPSKIGIECVGYPGLQGDVPIPRRPRNDVAREPCGDRCVNRLLCPETSRLHPLLDSALLQGLFTVGAKRALVVRVIPLAQPKIHSARCIRTFRNLQPPLTHEHVDGCS
jgi:hypothetical protein